jgi:3-hydroxybutyryl-CoA dehydratase
MYSNKLYKILHRQQQQQQQQHYLTTTTSSSSRQRYSKYTITQNTLTKPSAKDVKVGDACTAKWTITADEILSFGQLTGDLNPIHVDPIAASRTIFKKPIAHGLLCASLFPTIVSHCFPHSVYVSQTLAFKKPVFVNDTIYAQVRVIEAHETRKGTVLTCTTQCGRDLPVLEELGDISIQGEAKVLVLASSRDSSS